MLQLMLCFYWPYVKKVLLVFFSGTQTGVLSNRHVHCMSEFCISSELVGND